MLWFLLGAMAILLSTAACVTAFIAWCRLERTRQSGRPGTARIVPGRMRQVHPRSVPDGENYEPDANTLPIPLVGARR